MKPPARRPTVEGLVRIRPGLPRAHRVHVTAGTLHVRDIVTAEVDAEVRDSTRRNHTATHLLHAALRQVLGSHVKQAGSLVAPDRLRFDFAHFQAGHPRRAGAHRADRQRADPRATRRSRPRCGRPRRRSPSGAMALFGEKYGDQVRVVSVPGFSVELCGGTHVAATGDIGFFVILAEGGVAAGVRRIEAVTGAGAVQWAQRQRGGPGARDRRTGGQRGSGGGDDREAADRRQAAGSRGDAAQDEGRDGRHASRPATTRPRSPAFGSPGERSATSTRTRCANSPIP